MKKYIAFLQKEIESLRAENKRLKYPEEENKALRAEENKVPRAQEEKVLFVEKIKLEKNNKKVKENIKKQEEETKELKDKIKELKKKIKEKEKTIESLKKDIEFPRSSIPLGLIDSIPRRRIDTNDFTNHLYEAPEMPHGATYYESTHESGSNSDSLRQQDELDFSTFIEKRGQNVFDREESGSINGRTFSISEWMFDD